MKGEQFVREFMPLVGSPRAQLNVFESQFEGLHLHGGIGNGTHATQQMVKVVFG